MGLVFVSEALAAQEQARAARGRAQRVANMSGHLCVSRSAVGDRELKPGAATSCAECETNARDDGHQEVE